MNHSRKRDPELRSSESGISSSCPAWASIASGPAVCTHQQRVLSNQEFPPRQNHTRVEMLACRALVMFSSSYASRESH
eukprot:1628464-Rhodomonas_salina.1